MSSYATLSDLTTLGVASAALAGIATSEQQRAIDTASSLADSYLRNRFTLPIATPGQALAYAVARIAAYDLLSGRGYNPETGSDPNVRDRYLDAIGWLKGVASGSITPDLVDSSSGAGPGGPFVLQASTSTGVTVVGPPAARGW